MVWRLADALEVLRDEINARWPDRDKSSDGAIGDAAHMSQGSASDHVPWIIGSNGIGVVRAYDIDVDLNGDNQNNYGGTDIRALAEHLRELGEAGDERLIGGGYVIFAGQIASDVGGWAWRPYTGTDPHTSHIHLSVTRSGATPASPYPTTDPALFDHTQPWGVLAPEGDDMTRDEVYAVVGEALTAFFGDWASIESHVKNGCTEAIKEGYHDNRDQTFVLMANDIVDSLKK